MIIQNTNKPSVFLQPHHPHSNFRLHCQSKHEVHSEQMEDVLLCYPNSATTPLLVWQIYMFYENYNAYFCFVTIASKNWTNVLKLVFKGT